LGRLGSERGESRGTGAIAAPAPVPVSPPSPSLKGKERAVISEEEEGEHPEGQTQGSDLPDEDEPSAPAPPTTIPKSATKYDLPEGVNVGECAVFWLGGESLALNNLLLTHGRCSVRFISICRSFPSTRCRSFLSSIARPSYFSLLHAPPASSQYPSSFTSKLTLLRFAGLVLRPPHLLRPSRIISHEPDAHAPVCCG
jgi:hypothetical protein